jgi:hypothetical protein
VLLLVLGGGYVLLRAHVLPAQQLLKFTGAGTADVSVVNLTNDSFTITLAPASETGTPVSSASLGAVNQIMGPMNVEGFYKVQPGRYTLVVPRPDVALGGRCVLALDVGDSINVVVTPNGVYMYDNSNRVQSGSDLNYGGGSELCRHP